MQARILILCCGNPARGDDAIGEALFERLDKLGTVEVLFDDQLHIEHVFDLEEHDCTVFVDAAVNMAKPFEMRAVFPKAETSHSTHVLSPEALLEIYERVMKKRAPECHLLCVKGISFGLGEPLSGEAERNLEMAWDFLKDFLLWKRSLSGLES